MKNVMLVTVDSLRADHLNCYGYKKRKTSPNIDKIARKSIFCENAFTHGINTLSSLPSLLSGTYPLMLGFDIQRKITIAQILKKNRYRTIGLHSNAAVTAAGGYGKGFDVFRDISLEDRKLSFGKNWVVKYVLLSKGLPYTPAEKLVDACLKEISRHRGERLFVWLLFMDVHHPYLPPDLNLFGRIRALRLYNKARTHFAEKENGLPISEGEIEDLKRLYDDCIRYVDEEIGRLFDELDPDDWIFIFTADHGDELFEHGKFGHGTSFYEELIHIPLIIHNNDIPPAKIRNLVGHVDVVPTILEMLNIDYRKYPIHGINILNGQRGDVICEVLTRKGKGMACRTERWKLIKIDWLKSMELYDLKRDPLEKENLIEDRKDVSTELLKKLKDHEQFEKRETVRYQLRRAKIVI